MRGKMDRLKDVARIAPYILGGAVAGYLTYILITTVMFGWD